MQHGLQLFGGSIERPSLAAQQLDGQHHEQPVVFVQAPPLAIEIAHQLASWVVQRAWIGTAVVPDIPRWARERLTCTRGERTADRVMLIAGDTAHIPATQIDRCGTDVLQGHGPAALLIVVIRIG
jgi:hypothetical protein